IAVKTFLELEQLNEHIIGLVIKALIVKNRPVDTCYISVICLRITQNNTRIRVLRG
ncbi:hypothetical protein L9F63_000894, partial [Diploptera punctata]